MRKINRIVIFAILTPIIISCNLLDSKATSRLGWFGLLGFGGASSESSSSELPVPVNVTSEPTVTSSSSLTTSPSISGENSGFLASPSTLAVPRSVEGNFVPVGNIYDVGLDWTKVEGITKQDFDLIQFGTPVELKYSYDAEALSDAGFIEEFMVFYYDKETEVWRPVKGVRVDTEKKEVIALTDHFTPFVIAALPSPQGTGVASAPACINAEAPITGSGNATWAVFDLNFKYYKDRNYIIQPNASFYNLGFENALGIATCNGGTATSGLADCGSFADHKNATGTNYIRFQAPKNLTVYVMYDSRGPIDAPWLVNDGWTNTGLTIETTDAVGQYKVFAKDFLKNQTVSIHGNRSGLTLPTNINTNLWIVVKPQGSYQPGLATDICNNPTEGLAKLENVKGIPGSDRNTLLWDIPAQSNIQNVLIRRQLNFPTLSPSGGQSVNGIEHGRIGFTDLSLTINTTYYYTLFTVNANGQYSPGKVIELTTGVDQDADGIKDGYELNPDHVYDAGLPTIANSADSDGDGTNDLQEIINETDPRNSDAQKPLIQSFSLTSPSPTQMPVAIFNLQGTDNVGITHWILREGTAVPRKNDPDWQVQKPDTKLLDSMQTYNFSVWAKDAAGNISNAYTQTNVTLNGWKYPKYLFVSTQGSTVIKTFKYNLATKSLDLIVAHDIGGSPISEIIVHPSNQFLVSASNGLQILEINSEGRLSNKFYISREYPQKLKFDSSGRFLYAFETEWENGLPYEFFRTYAVDVNNRTLTPYSRYKFGRDSYEMVLHPMEDKIISGIVLGSDYGDSCSYGINGLTNGVVSGTLTSTGFGTQGCYDGVIENSGKYMYTQLNGDYGRSIISFLINGGSSISYTTDWSIDLGDWSAKLILHPNGKYVYVARANSNSIYLDTYEIDSNPSNSGRLNRVGQPYLVRSGSGFYDSKIDPTGRVIFIGSNGGDQSLSSIELDQTNGLPISRTTISTNGSSISPLSINNLNEPPVTAHQTLTFLTGTVSPGKHQTIFPNYCVIGVKISTGGIYYDNRICHGLITARDFDEVRCGSNPASLNITTKINGNNPDSISTIYYTTFKNHYSQYSFNTTSTGVYNLDYTVTDQPGNCVGGSQTVTKRDQITVKKLSIGDRIALPSTENRKPSPTRQFVMQWNEASYTVKVRRCEIFWLECGLTTSIDQLGNVLAMRYTCENKSRIESQYVNGWDEKSSRCTTRFPVNAVDAWFFKKRVVDLGISSTTYYWGNWYEAVD